MKQWQRFKKVLQAAACLLFFPATSCSCTPTNCNLVSPADKACLYACFCRWEWWNLWFEVALLLALFITCFLEQAFKRGRICFLAFFVLATQGCMWSAHNFLTQLEITAGGLDVRDLGQDAINAGEQHCPQQQHPSAHVQQGASTCAARQSRTQQLCLLAVAVCWSACLRHT